MSLELTTEQRQNYIEIESRMTWIGKKIHPKESLILDLLRGGVSVNRIVKEEHVSHNTVNEIRRRYGLWGA